MQIPVETLEKVFKLSDVLLSDQHSNYLWHLMLQTVILKQIKVHKEDQETYPFNFDFSIDSDQHDCDVAQDGNFTFVNLSNDASVDSVMSLETFYNVLSSSLKVKLEVNKDIEVVKIALHAFKRILRCIIAGKDKESENMSVYDNFIKILAEWNSWYSSIDNQQILENALKNCPCTVVNHAYATTSWNIPLNYLVIILQSYVTELFPSESLAVPVPLPKMSETLYGELKVLSCNGAFYRLHAAFLNESLPKCDFLKMLCKIIQYNFEGQSCKSYLNIFLFINFLNKCFV